MYDWPDEPFVPDDNTNKRRCLPDWCFSDERKSVKGWQAANTMQQIKYLYTFCPSISGKYAQREAWRDPTHLQFPHIPL